MATNDTRQCYNPIGAVWEGHTPCNQTADESHYCALNDFCLSNGNCLQAGGSHSNRIARGSCTDFLWRSTACPYECSDDAKLPDLDRQLWNDSIQYGSGKSHLESNRWIDHDNGTLLPSQIQQLEVQTTVTLRRSASPDSSSNDITAVAAGIAVPLGVLLLASLITIAFLGAKLRSLKKELKKGGSYPDQIGGPLYTQMGMQQAEHAPGPETGNTTPYTALPKYQPVHYQQSRFSEAPVEREVVEADARMPVQELGN